MPCLSPLPRSQTFMQGSVDDSSSVMMRLNQRWAPGHITKIQGQVSPAAA